MTPEKQPPKKMFLGTKHERMTPEGLEAEYNNLQQELTRLSTIQLLTDRAKHHGTFTHTAHIAQSLKHIVFQQGIPDEDMQEALDLICTKLARIVSGDPHHLDHWDDIAGYALLVADRLRGVSR